MKFRRLMLEILLAAIGLGPWLVPAARAQDAGYARVVRLSRAEGQVLVSHPGSDSWEEAPANLPLQEGDSLATQAGRAEIEFENGATGYLAENSVLRLTQLEFSGSGRVTQLDLIQGAGTFYANLTNQDSFRVRTPTFDVAIFERAEFRVDAFSDGAAAQVSLGNVYVSTTAHSIKLEKGQSVAIHQGDFNGLNTIARLPEEDSFDEWVNAEGEMIRSGNKSAFNYVSTQNNYGLSDLAIYGTWINLPGYGYSWRPFRVGLTWMPYLNGSWSLDPRLGWVWISGEPWGWMPYHFGSWLLSPTTGWVWVPGGPAGLRQWQPARVNWVQAGNRVGWVPMSPDDHEGIPANLAQGVITKGNGSSRTVMLSNEIVARRDMRGTTPLKQPPADFALHAAPSGARPGIVSSDTIRPVANRTAPQSPNGSSNSTGSIVFDRGTHTFINGNVAKPPVAPAALMPKPDSRAEIPRVNLPPSRSMDNANSTAPQINRIIPSRAYSPSPMSHGNVPTSGTIPAGIPMTSPRSATGTTSPPAAPIRVPSPPAAAQSPVAHTPVGPADGTVHPSTPNPAPTASTPAQRR